MYSVYVRKFGLAPIKGGARAISSVFSRSKGLVRGTIGPLENSYKYSELIFDPLTRVASEIPRAGTNPDWISRSDPDPTSPDSSSLDLPTSLESIESEC
jgi:hypothetical protein